MSKDDDDMPPPMQPMGGGNDDDDDLPPPMEAYTNAGGGGDGDVKNGGGGAVAEGKTQIIETLVEDEVDGVTVINGLRDTDTVLGKGAYGKVKLMENVRTGVLRAVKKMSKMKLKKMREFKRVPGSLRPAMVTALDKVKVEIEVHRMLDHPGIVELVAVIDDQDEDDLLLVLEHAPNGQIMKWSVKAQRYEPTEGEKGGCGGLPLAVIPSLFRGIVHALMYLHARGVIHRDIKPENILLGHDSIIKICDFGAAKSFDPSLGEGALVTDSQGTFHFMSPEACSGEEYSGVTTDVWAAGVTLWVMVFGTVPFICDSGNTPELFEEIREKELEWPESCSACPGALRELLAALLTKDPAERITLRQILDHEYMKV